MKTFIALVGVLVGGVTITAATILTVWNFTAGLLMLAAAFTVLVFTAWLIRRREDRDEVANVRLEMAWEQVRGDELENELAEMKITVEDLQADLRREREDRAAEQRRYATHMNACPVLDELMAEDHRKAQANR